jgi:hypothetical protein
MRKALVVGINDYAACPLNGCVNDAGAIASVLARNGDGSPNFSVKLLTSPCNSITRASLRRDIEDLFSGDCDVALLYFSGHGFVKSTGGYIVTPDFKKYDEGISMDEILKIANSSKIKDRVILLDCCFSGSFGTPCITGDFSLLSEGLTILTSSRSTESSMEIDGKGVFTTLVVDALNGGSADLRGNVSPGSIYSFVDQALGAWDQRPIFKTNVSRFTSLRNVAPPIPLTTLRKICDYFVNPQDEFKLDPSFEFTEKTAKVENVTVFKDLQRYESVGLVVPVGEDHMYFAAINSKSCKLTAMGYQYWKLVKEDKV